MTNDRLNEIRSDFPRAKINELRAFVAELVWEAQRLRMLQRGDALLSDEIIDLPYTLRSLPKQKSDRKEEQMIKQHHRWPDSPCRILLPDGRPRTVLLVELPDRLVTTDRDGTLCLLPGGVEFADRIRRKAAELTGEIR